MLLAIAVHQETVFDSVSITATGYKLRFTKVDHNLDPDTVIESIKAVLPQHAENIQLVSDMSYEFVINIGFPGSDQMVSVFKNLETNKEKLGVRFGWLFQNFL